MKICLAAFFPVCRPRSPLFSLLSPLSRTRTPPCYDIWTDGRMDGWTMSIPNDHCVVPNSVSLPLSLSPSLLLCASGGAAAAAAAAAALPKPKAPSHSHKDRQMMDSVPARERTAHRYYDESEGENGWTEIMGPAKFKFMAAIPSSFVAATSMKSAI